MDVGRPVPSSTQLLNNNATAASSSLYQQCLRMIERLYSLPHFDVWLFPDGLADIKRFSSTAVDALPIDPVAVLWDAFRLGAPLCALVNLFQLEKPLEVVRLSFHETAVAEDGKINNKCKAAVYHFLIACKAQLALTEDDLFTITQLYRNDTTGFVKALRLVTLILDRLESDGLYPLYKKPLPFKLPSIQDNPTDNREKVIAELLNTERSYVSALEKLQSYKNELLSSAILSRESIHTIFLNLDDLVDFQRRFLVSLEATLVLPVNDQRIGQVFIMNESGFVEYEAFCANYKIATGLVLKRADDLAILGHVIEPRYELSSYLIKPTQRVCKYPLLIRELLKLTPTSYLHTSELKTSLDVIESVTEHVNDAIRTEENKVLQIDLLDRVEDWKGLVMGDFGNLELMDKFLMTSDNGDREYTLYLFRKVLLCCKESRKKNSEKLTLKGNIFLSSITSVVNSSNTPEGIALKVFWRDGADLESFILKCRSDEQARKWKNKISDIIDGDKSRRKSVSVASMKSFMRKSQFGVWNDNSNSTMIDEDDEESNSRRGSRYRSGSVASSTDARGRVNQRDSAASKRSSSSSNSNSNSNTWRSNSVRSMSPPPRPKSFAQPPPLPPLPITIRTCSSSIMLSSGPTSAAPYSTRSSSKSPPLPFDAYRYASRSLPPPPKQLSHSPPTPVIPSAFSDSEIHPILGRHVSQPPLTMPPMPPPTHAMPSIRPQNSSSLANLLDFAKPGGDIVSPRKSSTSNSKSNASNLLASTIADLEKELELLGVDADSTPYSATSDSAYGSRASTPKDQIALPIPVTKINTTVTSPIDRDNPLRSSPTPSSSNYSPSTAPMLKLKLHYGKDTFSIAILRGSSYADLITKIEAKVSLCGNLNFSSIRARFLDPASAKLEDLRIENLALFFERIQKDQMGELFVYGV